MSSGDNDILFEKDESYTNAVEVDNSQDNDNTFEYHGWNAIEHVGSSKIKKDIPNTSQVDKVKNALNILTHQKNIIKESHSHNVYNLLESSGKFFFNGPRWSHPNHKQFNSINEERIESGNNPLMYIKKPNYVSQNDEIYHYKLQFPTEQQKLQAKNRYQTAIKFGLIALDNFDSSSYKVNQFPWELDEYKEHWENLASQLKHEPWKNKSGLLKPYIRAKPTEPEVIVEDTPVIDVEEDQHEVIPETFTNAHDRHVSIEDEHVIVIEEDKHQAVVQEKPPEIKPTVTVRPQSNFQRVLQPFTGQTKLTDFINKPIVHEERKDDNIDPFNFRSQRKIIEEIYMSQAEQQIQDKNNDESSVNTLDTPVKRDSKSSFLSSNKLLSKSSTSITDKSPSKLSFVQSITETDDEFDIEKTDLYEPVNKPVQPSKNGVKDSEPQKTQAESVSATDKKKKRLEFLNKMFEYEAEESEDENLSDPEYRKKIKLLRKKRLNDPSDSEEFSSDDDLEQLGDFVTTANANLNPDDEELARRRFYDDIQEDDENRLKKLMTIKNRVDKALQKRRVVHKKVKSNLGYDYHLSDFESSDDDSGPEYMDDEGSEEGSIDIDNPTSRVRHVQTKRRDSLKLFDKNLTDEQLELMDFLDYKLDFHHESEILTTMINNDPISYRGEESTNKLNANLDLDTSPLAQTNLLSETNIGQMRNALESKAIVYFQGFIKKNNPNSKCKPSSFTQ